MVETDTQENNVEIIKKKRGRKPKNLSIEENIVIEKKKRGRKKKYEIENFTKITNRENFNNFDHNIVYSSDEEIINQQPEIKNLKQEEKVQHVQKNNVNVKNISFGDLNITVSKKHMNDNKFSFKGMLKDAPSLQSTNQLINENELESDEEREIPIENIINVNKNNENNESNENNEKVYKENKKYVTDFTESIKEQSIKRLRVVTCCKNVVKDNEWPTTCDICCWWCCHTFENIPCTLPTRYDPLRKRYTYVGIFCSWNCVKSYNSNMTDHKKIERNYFITLLIKELYGIEKCINIKPAPPREVLKMFGGYLDINEFRNRYDKIEEYYINLGIDNFIFHEISELTNVKIKTAPTINVKNNNVNLRLSRN